MRSISRGAFAGGAYLGGVRTPSARFDALVMLAGTAVGAAILLARRPLRALDVSWAEDGAVFLHDAATKGISALFDTYSGYLHTVPRLNAMVIAAAVPVQWWAVACAVAAALVAASCITTIAVVAARVVRSKLVIGGLWWALIALPVAGGEVVVTLANLHWYLMVAAVWCVAFPTNERRIIILTSAVIALAILSDPLGAVLVWPVLAVRIAVRPWREGTWALAAAGVATAIQGVASLASMNERTLAETQPSLFDHVNEFGLRVVLVGLVGVTVATWLAANVAHILQVAAVIGLVGVALGAYFGPTQRWRVVTFLGMAVGLNAVLYTLQGQFMGASAWTDFTLGDRYAVAPVALFVSALAFAADGLARAGGARGTIALAAFLVIAVAPGLRDFNWGDKRAETARWSVSVREARTECATGVDHVHIPIGPVPPWSVQLPCSLIGD
ncbi:hypothetical protein [Demequina lutea]|uniref:Uncharacterized protein n=1 Tax=Demequina lutea TaxID=431489 RepID=A0A7Y9ZDW3_9MICO|nr:hypothetical protein [Demequina lutea]NYI42443.1 hypothetical protein [Demequina lutea]